MAVFCISVIGQCVAPPFLVTTLKINERLVLSICAKPIDVFQEIGWILNFFLPGWKGLWDIVTNRQTIIFF